MTSDLPAHAAKTALLVRPVNPDPLDPVAHAVNPDRKLAQDLPLAAARREIEDDVFRTDDFDEFDHATSVVISSHSREQMTRPRDRPWPVASRRQRPRLANRPRLLSDGESLLGAGAGG